MYYLQYERPCCIGYTKSGGCIGPIQHGREYCKVLVIRMDACKRLYSAAKILKIGTVLGEKIERNVCVKN